MPAADVQHCEGVKLILERALRQCRWLKVIFADSAYGRGAFPKCIKQFRKKVLQTVLRPVGKKGFVVVAKRWSVERAFGWLSHHRHLSKHYRGELDVREAIIVMESEDGSQDCEFPKAVAQSPRVG